MPEVQSKQDLSNRNFYYFVLNKLCKSMLLQLTYLFFQEYAVYYHLHTVHSTALIAFCKNCLVASVNMDRVYGHVVFRECSGSRSENPRLGLVRPKP